MSNLISSLADAITRQEGFFPGSVSYRNNNPGNIMDIAYYKETGKYKAQAYATLEEGKAALEQLLAKYVAKGNTLQTLFRMYAPSGHGGNDPDAYARNVAGWLGIPIDVPLNQLEARSETGDSQTSPASGGNPAPLPILYAEDEAGASTLPLLAGVGLAAIAMWWILS